MNIYDGFTLKLHFPKKSADFGQKCNGVVEMKIFHEIYKKKGKKSIFFRKN